MRPTSTNFNPEGRLSHDQAGFGSIYGLDDDSDPLAPLGQHFPTDGFDSRQDSRAAPTTVRDDYGIQVMLHFTSNFPPLTRQ